MNVAIFASAFHPHVGGVEELCRQLAHAHRSQGLGVTIVTNRWPRNLRAYELFEGIPVHRIPMRIPDGGFKAHINAHLTGRSIRNETVDILKRERVDLVHLQCVSSNAVYALHAKQKLDLPLVATAQGELSMDATGLYQRSQFMRNTLRDLLEQADYVTACSRHTLDELAEFRGRPFGDRANVVYNGVATDDFRRAPFFEHPSPYILGIGRLVHQKGFDVLIRAFHAAKLPGHDLLIAGDGPERCALENLAAELGLGNRVRFLGAATRDKAVALFRACSFFVLPSRHEPLGIVNLEAMAAGKAIIATRVGGVPEIVGDGVHGILVAPDSVEEMTRAVTMLALDIELRERLAAAACVHASRFSWATIAEQYRMIYAEVLSRREAFLCQAADRSVS